MDKTILKDFAIYGREKLIKEIKNKASLLGITEDGIRPPDDESTKDMLIFTIQGIESYRIYGKEVSQYEKLIEELNKRKSLDNYSIAYDSLVEEVAYTWFNRLIAIRFMEVNNYLPSRIRVLSSTGEGVKEPEIIRHYEDIDLNLTQREIAQFNEWSGEASVLSMDKLFHSLFIKQCNALNRNLPELFEKTDDYMELLLTISYNDPDGVLYRLVHQVPEEYFDIESEGSGGQVEIIGWLYQYYNSQPKAIVDAEVKKGKKVSKEKMPAKTQLFTPDWIVRYMVENSLGRLWIEKLIASGDNRSEEKISKDFNWKYYIPEAEQEKDVQEQLIELRKERIDLKLEDIRFIDPAMGSFHIGVYAFEVFMQLYESQGYTPREASRLIVEKNLYGIDLDKRAYQLSYFACMMKARQYNRRILNNEMLFNLFAISDSNKVNNGHLKYFGNSMKKINRNLALEQIEYLIEAFHDAKEYGSILKIDKCNWDILNEFIMGIDREGQISFDSFEVANTQRRLRKIIDLGKALAGKYNIVVTNPPYLGSGDINPKLSKHLKKHYPDSKSDLFAVFMEKCRELTKTYNYYGMITQHSWMFLSSYEKLRGKLQTNIIQNMVHLGPRAFEEIAGEVVQSTSFIYNNNNINNFIGNYIRLVDFNNAKEKEIKTLKAIGNPDCGYYYETIQDNYEKIPGMPVAYWASENFYDIFKKSDSLQKYAVPRQGMSTGDVDRFIRLWFEVIISETSIMDSFKWVKYNKGGSFRKWYGNKESVVYWNSDGKTLRQFKATIRNQKYYFKDFLGWSKISSNKISFRDFADNFLFDGAGGSLFLYSEHNKLYIHGLLNTIVSKKVLSIISPTMNFNESHIGNIPIIFLSNNKKTVELMVNQNINISKTDWDSFETSWDFKKHPLLEVSGQGLGISDPTHYPLNTNHSIEMAYETMKDQVNNRFAQLKKNEEELNEIFIEIYGLENELTPEISDKDITIAKIFDSKDQIYDDIKGNRYILTKEDVIKSLISYGLGCIFGRYSLDVEGLAYAGGDFSDKYLVISGQYYLKEAVYRYVSDELSRLDSMAKGNDLGRGNIQDSEITTQGGDLYSIRSDAEGSSLDSFKYSRGTTEKINQGIYTVSDDSKGFKSRVGDPDFDLYQAEILDAITNGDISGLVSRGWENAERIDWKAIHHSLTTNHLNIVKDNIIIITDEDYYFEDDIVSRFIDFIKKAFGEGTLEENLAFIADSLGGNGTPKEIIRNYFLKSFYKDHVKTYKKRPIYWLYDSGKENAFKALIYLHRYDEDTTGKVRIDYLHKVQKAYERSMDNLRYNIAHNKNPREVAKAEKALNKLTKQLKETKAYDERIGHMALARVDIDLDDGVKVNHQKVQTDEKGKNLNILASI